MLAQDSVAVLMEKGLHLDMGGHALSKLLARYELFKIVRDFPGDIIECGVYRGASLFQWANFIEVFAPHSQKVVIGFDTFSGFSAQMSRVEDRQSVSQLTENSARFLPRTKEEIQSIAKSLGLAERVELVAGDATVTIPNFVRENLGLRISLLNLDFDVYEPTKAALESFYPLLVPGGVVILDQYGSRGWGESDAADEFFVGKGLRYQRLSWAAGPAAFVVKKVLHNGLEAPDGSG